MQKVPFLTPASHLEIPKDIATKSGETHVCDTARGRISLANRRENLHDVRDSFNIITPIGVSVAEISVTGQLLRWKDIITAMEL